MRSRTRTTSTSVRYSSDSVSRGHHLVGRADPEPAVDQVEHPVDDGQHRVDLVGHEQHRGAVLTAASSMQVDDGALVGEVEREQRLVAQQHAGSPTRACATRSRCCSPPESRPTGASARSRAPTAQRLAAPPRPLAPAPRRAGPAAVPVEAEPDEVAPAQRGQRVDGRAAAGRTRRVAFPRRGARPSTSHVPAASGEQAEQHPEQGRLARAVRARARRRTRRARRRGRGPVHRVRAAAAHRGAATGGRRRGRGSLQGAPRARASSVRGAAEPGQVVAARRQRLGHVDDRHTRARRRVRAGRW